MITAVNSINNSPKFKGTSYSNASRESREQALDAVKEKARQDVSPLTVAATTVLSLAAIAKGKDKIVPLARKVIIKGGELISSGIVKTFGNIVNKINKKQPFNSAKAAEKITKFADKLRGEGENSKMLESIGGVLKDVIGKEKSQKVTDFLQNNGVTNWVKAFDAMLATAFVVPLADRFSDSVEQVCDDSKIARAAKALDLILED